MAVGQWLTPVSWQMSSNDSASSISAVLVPPAPQNRSAHLMIFSLSVAAGKPASDMAGVIDDEV